MDHRLLHLILAWLICYFIILFLERAYFEVSSLIASACIQFLYVRVKSRKSIADDIFLLCCLNLAPCVCFVATYISCGF